MVIQLPNGRLEFYRPPSRDIAVIAIPENFDGGGLRMFPPDMHAVFTPNSATREKQAMIARYRKFLKKHKAESSQMQLLLVTTAFISESDAIEYGEVEILLAAASIDPLPHMAATLGHLVRRGLCRRTGRGWFVLTDAGRAALDLQRDDVRPRGKTKATGIRLPAAATA